MYVWMFGCTYQYFCLSMCLFLLKVVRVVSLVAVAVVAVVVVAALMVLMIENVTWHVSLDKIL